MFIHKLYRHSRRPISQFLLNRNVSNGSTKIDNKINKLVLPSYCGFLITKRNYNSSIQLPSSESNTSEVSSVFYEQACTDTLEALCEFFEDLVENVPHLKLGDVSYGVS